MSKLNKDTLFLLFEELQDDSKSLFSCLMVNRLWCETVIPILWKNPWRYSINYCKKSSLYRIITFYLTNNTKEALTSQGIQLPQISNQSLLFDYLSFCKNINVGVINSVMSFGSSSDYSKFLLEQEFYNVLMKKCSELKCLNMKSIKHQIFYFPEAKARLESLCELECDTSINPSYFYGLVHICQNIQRLIIINTGTKENNGIVKLIKVQNNLKYFEWRDNFDGDKCYIDPYEKIFLTLAEKADTLNHLTIDFQYFDVEFDEYEHKFLQNLLPKLCKLRTLKINEFYLKDDRLLRTLVFHNLEIFDIDFISMETATCIIENSGGHLREISLSKDLYWCIGDDNHIFIRKIYEHCPLVECLSLAFPPFKEHFTEFENLLKACQNLKSLLLLISNINEIETQEKLYKNGEDLLKILIRFAPTKLREIRFFNDFKFSLEALETFLEKWKGRPALSILTCDSIYNGKDYIDLINKYKSYGVIKDFRYYSNENYIYF